MHLTQSKFSEYIGVSKKTITLMKQKQQIIMNGSKVDVERSIELLKSIGRNFDVKNKMITSNTIPKVEKKESEPNLLNTNFIYPELSQMELKEKESREIELLKREAEKEGLTIDKILTVEIDSLEPIEINKIKVFWQGLLEKVKYEKEIGLLVSKDEVYEEQFKVARTVRDAVMGISNRIAHKLIGKTEMHEIKNIIDMEAQKVLENLSK